MDIVEINLDKKERYDFLRMMSYRMLQKWRFVDAYLEGGERVYTLVILFIFSLYREPIIKALERETKKEQSE